MNYRSVLLLGLTLLLPVLAWPQGSVNADSLFLTNGEIITAEITAFYPQTLTFTKDDHPAGVRLSVLNRVSLDGRGLVFRDSSGYLFPVDSLNALLKKRTHWHIRAGEALRQQDHPRTPGYFDNPDAEQQISIGWGAGTPGMFIGMFDDVFLVLGHAIISAFIGNPDDIIINEEKPFQMLAAYRYIPGPGQAIGLCITYEQTGSRYRTESGDWSGWKRLHLYTIAFETEYYWLHGQYFHLYSGVGVGAMFQNYTYGGGLGGYSENRTSWAAQLNLLGLSFGGRFKGFVQAGGGYRGILSGGFSWQL